MKTTKKKSGITRSKDSSTLYVCLITVLITLAVFNISMFFFKNRETSEIQYVFNNTAEKQITFWNAFLNLHPTYLEGWVQLAKLEIKTGNTANAKAAFTKAWKINPNSQKVLNLKKELNN